MYVDRAFSRSAPSLWNCLLEHIRALNSQDHFETILNLVKYTVHLLLFEKPWLHINQSKRKEMKLLKATLDSHSSTTSPTSRPSSLAMKPMMEKITKPAKILVQQFSVATRTASLIEKKTKIYVRRLSEISVWRNKPKKANRGEI